MPLEIRELIIKATVDNQGTGPSVHGGEGEETSEATLNEVAARVLAIIKEKMER